MTFHLFLVFVMCLLFISLVSLMGCPGHPRKSPYRLRKRTDSQQGDQAPYLAKGHHLHKTEEVQPQKSWLHPRISELATGKSHQFTLALGVVWRVCHIHVLFKQSCIKIFSPNSKQESLKLWRDTGAEGKLKGEKEKRWRCKIAEELHLVKCLPAEVMGVREGSFSSYMVRSFFFLHGAFILECSIQQSRNAV